MRFPPSSIDFSQELIDRIFSIAIKQGRFGGNSWITVEKRVGAEGIRWAVCDHGLVLNKSGEWEHEPFPSSRSDAFLSRCRFDSFEDAWQAAYAAGTYEYRRLDYTDGN